jgi:hypothetical protein
MTILDQPPAEPSASLVHDVVSAITHRPWRIGTAVVAGVAAVVAAPAPAYAHYVYEEERWYNSSTHDTCIYQWGEVSHGSDGGYAKSRTEATWSGSFCGWTGPNRPAGAIGAKYRYWKYDPVDGSWDLCASIGYRYNENPSYDKVTAYDFGEYAPCGYGTYQTVAFGKVYVNNSAGWLQLWDGVVSGPHDDLGYQGGK